MLCWLACNSAEFDPTNSVPGQARCHTPHSHPGIQPIPSQYIQQKHDLPLSEYLPSPVWPLFVMGADMGVNRERMNSNSVAYR